VKKLLALLFLLSCSIIFAQNEGNIWYFGNHSGLDFNSGIPVALTNGQINTIEGCAVMSDPSGLLLFYTDGITVWNKNHTIMDNGTNLDGHESTAQSATIIQKPGSNNLFYIFTIDAAFGVKGFRYSIVDISLNSGLGSVITKNTLVRLLTCEKLAIIKHPNNLDFWVIVHGSGSNFYSYFVNSAGISNSPIVSSIGFPLELSPSAAEGIMKANITGTKLAFTNIGHQRVELFDFNSATGVISNNRVILVGTTSSDNYYGIEFSPNGNLLYVSNVSSPDIKQFDLNVTNIAASEVNLSGGFGDFLGALQLGPDGKIYVSRGGRDFLGVINQPNNYGNNCDYQLEGVNLSGNTNNLGLPTSYVINHLLPTFSLQSICSNSEVTFSITTSLPITSVLWDFGDGNSSTQLSAIHNYANLGNYNVTLTANTLTSTFIRHLNITINSQNATASPLLNSPQTFCIQQNATINDIAITGQNIKWYDAPTGGNLLSSTTILQNSITYYASQTISTCESARVPVLITIFNTPAPIGSSTQTFCATQNATLNDVVVTGTTINWYSSVSSISPLPLSTLLVDGVTYFASQTANGCESIGRLSVSIGLLTTLNAVDYATTVCDIGNDGSELVDLSQFNANLVTVSGNIFTYYKSNNGAENQIVLEQLATNHTINLGLNTIYVRIDSVNGCNQIVKLELTLVSVPLITITDEVVLCENRNVTVNAGSGFSSYLWSTGATSASIVITIAGNYSVTVTKNYGGVVCTSTKNFIVVLSNAPIITSINTVDWTDTENSITIILSSTSIGSYEYSIDGINYQTSNIFNGLPNGSYLVHVRDIKECGFDTEQAFLLNYPKYFTPNGDGYHDSWSIKFSQFEPNFEVKIFDRYGKLLKVMTNQEGWDGNFNGRQLPSDDYWFVVTRNDGRTHRGHFAMKR
jgi:gliding motility-associated-like protein